MTKEIIKKEDFIEYCMDYDELSEAEAEAEYNKFKGNILQYFYSIGIEEDIAKDVLRSYHRDGSF